MKYWVSFNESHQSKAYLYWNNIATEQWSNVVYTLSQTSNKTCAENIFIYSQDFSTIIIESIQNLMCMFLLNIFELIVIIIFFQMWLIKFLNFSHQTSTCVYYHFDVIPSRKITHFNIANEGNIDIVGEGFETKDRWSNHISIEN